MQPVDRPGNFRGKILEFGIHEAESGAVAINMRVSLDGRWDSENGEWDDEWSQYEQFADGAVWVIKKDGTLNDRQIESLCRYAGWDAQLKSVQDQSWEPTPCAFVVNEDNYGDEQRFRVSFINAYDSTPGGMGQVSADKLKELEKRFGSQLRAIAGNVNRGSAKDDKPKPNSPKRPEMAAAATGDDIPF